MDRIKNGFMSALAAAYEAVCEDCEAQLMAIAITHGAEPDSPK